MPLKSDTSKSMPNKKISKEIKISETLQHIHREI